MSLSLMIHMYLVAGAHIGAVMCSRARVVLHLQQPATPTGLMCVILIRKILETVYLQNIFISSVYFILGWYHS